MPPLKLCLVQGQLLSTGQKDKKQNRQGFFFLYFNSLFFTENSPDLPNKAINKDFFKEHSFGAKIIRQSSKTPFYDKAVMYEPIHTIYINSYILGIPSQQFFAKFPQKHSVQSTHFSQKSILTASEHICLVLSSDLLPQLYVT